MKKKYIIAPAVMVVLIFAWVASMAGERVDPTGVLSRLLEIEHAHSESMQSFLQHLKLDYHPQLGTVKKETLPYHKEGWDDTYSAQLFPGKKMQAIESVSRTIFPAHYWWLIKQMTAALFISGTATGTNPVSLLLPG